MLFAAPQLEKALNSVWNGDKKNFVIYPSPQGVLLNQELIESLALQENLIIICGHYEGIDERFIKKYVDLEFSVGDCVLTGGEIPAMTVIDSVSRLIPGVIGRSRSVIEDSFYRGMLDNPNYTRPAEWNNLKVPEVLLSGNAGEISKWRRAEAVKRTLTRRPDLISRASISEYVSGKIYLCLIARDAVLNDDINKICVAYGISRPYIIAEDHKLRDKLKNSGVDAKIIGNIFKLLENKNNALIIKVYPEIIKNSLHCLEVKRRCLEHSGDIIFLFADNSEDLNNINIDLKNLSAYIFESEISINLSNLIAVSLDRFLGRR